VDTGCKQYFGNFGDGIDLERTITRERGLVGDEVLFKKSGSALMHIVLLCEVRVFGEYI